MKITPPPPAHLHVAPRRPEVLPEGDDADADAAQVYQQLPHLPEYPTLQRVVPAT